MNKNSLFIGLGVSGFFTLASVSGLVAEKTPPSIAQCEKQADHSEAAFRSVVGYELSSRDRMEFLHIGALRRECIDEAKAGPRLTIVGL